MRYVIYMLPDTKDLAINQTMVAYGNRQNATFNRNQALDSSLRLDYHVKQYIHAYAKKSIFNKLFKIIKYCKKYVNQTSFLDK